MYRIWIRPKKAAHIVQLAEHVLLIKGSGVRIPGGSPGIGRPEMGGLLHCLSAGMAGALPLTSAQKADKWGTLAFPLPPFVSRFPHEGRAPTQYSRKTAALSLWALSRLATIRNPGHTFPKADGLTGCIPRI